jgi:hypothetical protein
VGEAEDGAVEVGGGGAEVAGEAGLVEGDLADVGAQVAEQGVLALLAADQLEALAGAVAQGRVDRHRLVGEAEAVGAALVDAEQEAVDRAQEGGLAGLVGAVDHHEAGGAAEVEGERLEVAEALELEALKLHARRRSRAR